MVAIQSETRGPRQEDLTRTQIASAPEQVLPMSNNLSPDSTNSRFLSPSQHQLSPKTPNTSSPPSQLPLKKKKKKKGTRKIKNMRKIKNTDDFTTFIDHGCTLDDEQFPLYPNGETVFVRLPDAKVTNFGIIGYSHTTNVTGAHDKGDWKTTRVKCLGVMRCQMDTCDFRGPPPTGNNAIADLMRE